MSSYEPCAGTGWVAVNPRTAHTADLGSKFARMNGKRFGDCPHCGRTGLALRMGTWPTRSLLPMLIPRHKPQPPKEASDGPR